MREKKRDYMTSIQNLQRLLPKKTNYYHQLERELEEDASDVDNCVMFPTEIDVRAKPKMLGKQKDGLVSVH